VGFSQAIVGHVWELGSRRRRGIRPQTNLRGRAAGRDLVSTLSLVIRCGWHADSVASLQGKRCWGRDGAEGRRSTRGEHIEIPTADIVRREGVKVNEGIAGSGWSRMRGGVGRRICDPGSDDRSGVFLRDSGMRPERMSTRS